MGRGFLSKQPKNLDPFDKTDLDFVDCLERSFFLLNSKNLDQFYKNRS